jgi:1,4-dihydroxy-2-naphthoyl-CoA synthase
VSATDSDIDSDTSYTDIEYAVADAVATITINRPERLNAFTIHTLGEMTHAVAAAGKDDGVGVIVITGAGDRAFCAGGDVNIENEETFSGGEHAAAFDEVVKILYEQIRDCPEAKSSDFQTKVSWEDVLTTLRGRGPWNETLVEIPQSGRRSFAPAAAWS